MSSRVRRSVMAANSCAPMCIMCKLEARTSSFLAKRAIRINTRPVYISKSQNILLFFKESWKLVRQPDLYGVVWFNFGILYLGIFLNCDGRHFQRNTARSLCRVKGISVHVLWAIVLAIRRI